MNILLKKNSRGFTVLDRVLETNPEVLLDLIKMLPEADRYAALFVHTNLLHEISEKYSESFNSFWFLLPQESQLLLTECKLGLSLFHSLAMNNVYALPDLLKSLPKSARSNIIYGEDYSGNTFLGCVATADPVVLPSILKLLPKSELAAVINQQDKLGRRLLHNVARIYPAILPAIFNLLPESDRLAPVQEKSRGYSVLIQIAAANLDVFFNILALIPKTDQLSAIGENHESENNFLYWAATHHPECVPNVLLLLSKEERFEAVNQKDNCRKTVLHWIAANDPSVLLSILSLLPGTKRLPAITEPDICGQTPLHIIDPKFSEILIDIIKLLPEPDRLTAIECEDKFGNTVLQIYKNKRSKFLELLPKKNSQAKLTESDHSPAFFKKEVNHKVVAEPRFCILA